MRHFLLASCVILSLALFADPVFTGETIPPPVYLPIIGDGVQDIILWNTFLGSSEYDGGSDIAVDSCGAVYVAGASNATWDNPLRAYTGFTDAFVAKLGSNGGVLWHTFLGGSSIDSAIAVDSNGAVYVTGTSDATWGSPVQEHAGSSDVFIARLASNGDLIWNTFLGSSEFDYSKALAVDSSGNVYVGGFSYATWGNPVRPYTDDVGVFVAKLTSSGELTWNTFLGSAGLDDVGKALAVNSSGAVYVAGNSGTTWGNPLRPNTGGDAFVAKLASSGELNWNTFLGSSDFADSGHGLAVDTSGNVYVVGSNGRACFRCIISYAYVAKLTSSGELLWNTVVGGTGTDGGSAIAVDSIGDVYVVGGSGTTWGNPVGPYRGNIFVAKLTGSGELTWHILLGSGNQHHGAAITVDSSGAVYVAGTSGATWGNPVRPYTGNDAFVVKLSHNIGLLGINR